ncbi:MULTISPECIES: excalibur calcium-binding domain-containing protein [Streptomyces]|uniref:excalibur calcium-binding domain-containing protein n=1 Tax=Streptomyces TaxID=1883 RepID=UPI0004C62586|nr:MULTISPECIES: excalibur calcium-binding domain-containing protein [Streptomyces]MDX3610097.1 excalibur calcium-binding domain-containing protein [Streptomyces sp. FL06-04B]MDX3736599.1 excalibur calcium-binding domain-containing protein [Streptomyces sp. ID01-15D]
MDWNSPQHPSRRPGWGRGGDFTPPPPSSTGGPRWARKRVVLPAAGALFVLGVGIGATGEQPQEVRTVAAKAKPGPTVTVTETAKVTVTAAPEPAPTVTKVKKVRVTVTAAPPEAEPAKKPVARDDEATGSGGGSGGTSAYYKNCDAVRAAGASPIRSGQPGYGPHLDRDGDGVGCE